MLHVFISYSREDASELKKVIASVQNIIDAQEAHFWFDDKIPGGVEFELVLNNTFANRHE